MPKSMAATIRAKYVPMTQWSLHLICFQLR